MKMELLTLLLAKNNPIFEHSMILVESPNLSAKHRMFSSFIKLTGSSVQVRIPTTVFI